MLIRPEQLQAFEPQADADFIARFVEYLLEERAEDTVRFADYTTTVEGIPDRILNEMVRRGVARARRYGITWESSLACFVSLMFEVAPNFDEHPLIRRVLRDEGEPPDQRLELLWEQITDENWTAAEEAYDPEAWGVDFVP